MMRHAGWLRSSNVTLNKRHDKVGGGVTEARTLRSRYVSYTLSDWALCSKLCITVILSRTRKLEPSSTVERHCTRSRRGTLIAGKFTTVPAPVNFKINLTFKPEHRLGCEKPTSLHATHIRIFTGFSVSRGPFIFNLQFLTLKTFLPHLENHQHLL